MVNLIGSGKMPASAMPIGAVSLSEIITEEVGTQKITAKYVPRELHDADEANLIDEEDMHVYDLMPLSDPLNLVCCNACRKPIKISQYAAHAGQLSCTERTPSKDGPGISPGISDYLTDAEPPPTKRTKSIPAQAVDKSDHLTITTGVTKSSCQNTQGKNICAEHLKGSTDQLRCFGLQLQRKALLGAKMFYSLRNHRLRSAIKCMYYESFSQERSDDVHPDVSQGDETELQVSVTTNSHEELKLPMEKGEKQPSTFALL